MSLPQRIDRRDIRGKPKLRSDAHRRWVRGHYCCVHGCYEMPIDCAHINRASTRGVGMKASDAFCISLCHQHHMESHQGEKTFERKHKLDLMKLAREFYDRSPHKQKLDNPYV